MHHEIGYRPIHVIFIFPVCHARNCFFRPAYIFMLSKTLFDVISMKFKISGISKCHYLKWSAQNGYLIRDLACHCKSSCGCFNPRTFNYAYNCSSGGLDTFDKTNESDLTTCPELSTSSSPVVAVPLKSDDWILVGLETGDNRKKHFVAQITSRFENGDFRVRFLKQYTFRGRFNEFVDSLVTDCSVISPWEIVRKLDDPTIDRRGIKVFADIDIRE